MTIFKRTPVWDRGECDGSKGPEPLSTSVLSRAPRRKPETVSRHPTAKETLETVLARLEDMKAEDSVVIDLTGKSSIGDYMVVTSGRSQRHVSSMADHVVKDIEEAGGPRARFEGMRQGDWVLIDAGDVIVHVFRPEIRAFYNLEKMWAAASRDARQRG